MYRSNINTDLNIKLNIFERTLPMRHPFLSYEVHLLIDPQLQTVLQLHPLKIHQRLYPTRTSGFSLHAKTKIVNKFTFYIILYRKRQLNELNILTKTIDTS